MFAPGVGGHILNYPGLHRRRVPSPAGGGVVSRRIAGATGTATFSSTATFARHRLTTTDHSAATPPTARIPAPSSRAAGRDVTRAATFSSGNDTFGAGLNKILNYLGIPQRRVPRPARTRCGARIWRDRHDQSPPRSTWWWHWQRPVMTTNGSPAATPPTARHRPLRRGRRDRTGAGRLFSLRQ